jgi:hypothetical protein
MLLFLLVSDKKSDSSALRLAQAIIMRPAVREAGWSVMMTQTERLARTRALPAIAAALALSSTSALAQEAAQQTQPVTEPAPSTTTQPAPSTDQPPPAPDTSATTQTTNTSAQTPTRTTLTIKRTTHVATAKPAAVPPKSTVARSTATHATTAATIAAAPKAPAAAPAPPQSAVAPVVRYAAKPAPQQNAASNSINLKGNMAPIAAGGALALLALGGAAAVAAGRRRRRKEQEWADEQTMAYEPFEETAAVPETSAEPKAVIHEEQPAVVAPAGSAFAWGSRRAGEPVWTQTTTAEQDDRKPGETWVERAYRGPTPNNPSVSLRNRLKRAAFFDKREREAAAGLAQPVNANAGLPGAMAGERELG